ncbi:MAG: ribonuclease P protein component [Betaproteobacteria bacterium]|nr:ribonuclease P protein component [Betaproteobacteria bacterium]
MDRDTSCPSGFSFRRQNRLTKTDDFSSVFSLRNILRSRNFFLHYRRRERIPEGGQAPEALIELPARLGLVIAKRFVASAVRRNLLKRLARENFRLLRQQLSGYDLVLRLAASPQDFDRRLLSGEIRDLLEKLRSRSERARTEMEIAR